MEVNLAQELNLSKAGNIAKWAVISLFFILTYLPVFADLHAKYSAIDSYYGHGYLIPLVSVFIIWHKRNELKSMKVLPLPAGLWVFGGGLLLYVFGRWWYVNFFSDLSMLIVLAGFSLYLFGAAITRELMFPLAFLLFMIPLPKISIIYITFWLKLLAASAATEIVSAMGIPVLLEGAFIRLPNVTLEIENACSGLRSLIALTALGVVFAYFLRISFLKKCIFVLTTIPIAIAANVIRIVILVLVSYFYGPGGRAFEMTDFTTGYLVFVITLLGLYVVSKGAIGWERGQMANAVHR